VPAKFFAFGREQTASANFDGELLDDAPAAEAIGPIAQQVVSCPRRPRSECAGWQP